MSSVEIKKVTWTCFNKNMFHDGDMFEEGNWVLWPRKIACRLRLQFSFTWSWQLIDQAQLTSQQLNMLIMEWMWATIDYEKERVLSDLIILTEPFQNWMSTLLPLRTLGMDYSQGSRQANLRSSPILQSPSLNPSSSEDHLLQLPFTPPSHFQQTT